MNHLPSLKTFEVQPGFAYVDTERVICTECAGYGYHYASTGPSGATIDCDHCEGYGGWLADLSERFSA